MKTTSKLKTPPQFSRSGGLSSQTMFSVPDTYKSRKQQPSIANWNYSGSAWVGSGCVGSGRDGSARSNSDYKAISASQQSWSLGLAELGNTSLNYLIYQTRAWNFVFRKLEFDTIYYAYLNESTFKYYISILGVEGSEAMLILLIQNLGKPLLCRDKQSSAV